ncbi:MAG: restriction endonuclease subunit R [Symploca sp. SIO2G7]|nr:restriction endonuclease subunit R [Symploca sp. SIO2G7]
MVQVLQASDLSLYEVEEKFNLQQVEQLQFFWEWQGELPELSTHEKQCLDWSREDFLSLAKYPLHEEIVKLSIVAPLLSLAGLLRYPFYPQAEAEIKIAVEDKDEVVRGRVDVRILLKRLSIVVIESKNKQFSIDVALPQALVYLMSGARQEKPLFGLITNGKHFQFIKLIKQECPRYALSDEFTIANRENGLYQVLRILKRLKEIVQQG